MHATTTKNANNNNAKRRGKIKWKPQGEHPELDRVFSAFVGFDVKKQDENKRRKIIKQLTKKHKNNEIK